MKASKLIASTKIIFLILAVGVCLYLILSEMYMPAENRIEHFGCKDFSDGWKWVKDDNTVVDAAFPGKNDVPRGEVMVLQNTLPDYLEDNLYMCFRSSKQETRIYIDDVLRQEYSTEDTRLFGRVSAVAFVYVQLNAEDAGKTIRVEMSTDSSYTGVTHEVFYGEMIDIWQYLFEKGGVELIIASFVLILGLASIVISIALKICYKKRIEMEYLGWGIFLAAIWIIANSVFRQMIFPNISAISDMAFFMVMLLSIPFLLYFNQVQSERYAKVYLVAIIANIVDFIVCTLLHVLNIIDFSDSIKVMVTIAGASIALLGVTMVLDIISGRIKEYFMVALGILGVCLSAIVQIVLYFKWTTQFSGAIIAVAMVFVLIISFVNTMKDILGVEKEKQKAVLSNQAKGKFLANMSHEIRTPINAILGMDSMILRECEDDTIKEYAMNIQNAGQTLLYLINDILDFSKIESGKMEIIPVEYEFSSMIHDVVNMIMIKANDKGLDMNVSVNKNLPFKMYGDEIRIRQILVNLLTNAVKYTKEGEISLTVDGEVKDDEAKIYFAVEDTGIGIKEEDISKLFERFERIEEERNRNIEGTGLGMSITVQLLKLMGSELSVESVYGKGSKFSFYITQKVLDKEPIGDLEERIRNMSSGYKYNATFVAPEADILVVDDNMINRKVFINLLKETKVKIDEAESGMACLELVREKHYDIIFLDHMMPQMDGIETLHRMKEMADSLCENTPVIALTANAISGAREMYIKEGFNDFLSKPIKTDKLEDMIEELLPEDKVSYEERTKKEDSQEKESSRIEKDLSKLPQIDGIEWGYALANMPDVEILENTVKNFYKSIDIEADALESFWLQSDNEEMLNEYRIKVHAMKSSAAYIGALMLSSMAKTLEYAARDGKVEIVKYMTPSFLTEWREYKNKLSMYEEIIEKKDVENKEDILAKLERLSISLDEMEVDEADEIMDYLRQFQYGDEGNKIFKALEKKVLNLEAEEACEIIDKLKEV
ncbi:MAG: response regulator, partial [Lachnospiraceae bacterium]|nr:response regulator [Lachnospiraceae bacterium]